MNIPKIKTAADAAAYVKRPRSAVRESRHRRCRRHHARQIHGARQVRVGAREGLRLLRRGAGLGFQRPALRQRRHCTGWHTAYPDAAVRILPETMRADPVRGRHCRSSSREFDGYAEAACPRGSLRRVLTRPRTWASRFRPRPSSSSSCSRRRRTPCATRASATSSRSRRAFSAIRCCAAGVHSDFYHELLDTRSQDGFRDRGPAYGDRPRRARSGDPGRRCPRRRPTRRPCSRRSPRSSRSGAAGWRPSWPNGRATGPASPAICTRRFATSRAARALLRREGPASACRDDDALVRRRAAGADAGTLAMVAPHGELLHAPDPRLLGADRLRPGASRTAPRRCASSRARRSRSASSTGSRRPTSTRISRSRPRSARACGASRTRSSPATPIQGNAYDGEHPKERALPRSLGEAAGRLKASQAARERFSATPSSTIMPQPANGKSAKPARPSPIGSSPAISRSSESDAIMDSMTDIVCISPIDGRELVRRPSSQRRRNRRCAVTRARARRRARGAPCRSPERWRQVGALPRRAPGDEPGGRARARPADGPAGALRRRVPAASRSARATWSRIADESLRRMFRPRRTAGFRRMIKREPLGVVLVDRALELSVPDGHQHHRARPSSPATP